MREETQRIINSYKENEMHYEGDGCSWDIPWNSSHWQSLKDVERSGWKKNKESEVEEKTA